MTPWPRPPRHGRTGAQLALGFTQVCVFPCEPSRTDTDFLNSCSSWQPLLEHTSEKGPPSTRQAYDLKWSLFTNWCSSRREDPQRCTIGVVLSFLQERLEHRLPSSTLRAYVAAITAHHDAVDGRFLGKQDLIVWFLRGARRLHPPRPPLVPSWDLSIVLAGLQWGPVELLESVRAPEALSSFCLLQRLAEREGCLQAEVGPLDSGCHRLGVPIPRRAVPPGGEGSRHTECCLLLCIGAQCLSGRHLQSCGLGDTLKTFSALSQSLPLCWVTGKWWEELASVTLAAPFLLTWGCKRHFPPPVSSPDGEPWWSSSSTPAVRLGGAVWHQGVPSPEGLPSHCYC